jgi:hypothetical protein
LFSLRQSRGGVDTLADFDRHIGIEPKTLEDLLRTDLKKKLHLESFLSIS